MAITVDRKSSGRAKGKTARVPASRASIITVIQGDKTPHDALMKLPKAQIVRTLTIPENRSRYLIDVDNRTTKGKRIIALMDSLCRKDPDAVTTVSEILAALAQMVGKRVTSKK